MKQVAKAVGENLKQARKLKKLSQAEVAKRMNMTQQQYSRFENGRFELNYSQILELCDMLEISPNELFSVELEKKSYKFF